MTFPLDLATSEASLKIPALKKMAKVDCFNENNLCYNIKNVQIILKNLATFSNPYSLSFSFLVFSHN